MSKIFAALSIGLDRAWEFPHEKCDWWPVFEATNRDGVFDRPGRDHVVYFTPGCITARTCPVAVSAVS